MLGIYLVGIVTTAAMLASLFALHTARPLPKHDVVVAIVVSLLWPLVFTLLASLTVTGIVYYIIRGVLKGVAIGVDKI